MIPTLIWGGFIAFILALLALDLGVFNRRPHEITVFEAAAWSAFWIALPLAFNVLIFWLFENDWVGIGLAFSERIYGRTAALEFLTAYLLEKSLSLDNIFVIALIFAHFQVPLASDGFHMEPRILICRLHHLPLAGRSRARARGTRGGGV